MTKNLLIAALITIIILLLWQWQCHGRGGAGVIKSDTVTVYKYLKSDTAYIPKPYKVFVDKIRYVPVHTEKWDTLYLPELIGMTMEDTLAILADYYATYFYSDTIRNQYGKVTINDTVTQNKLSGRGVIQDFKIPITTITNTVVEKRNQVYVGAGVLGNLKDPLRGYELNLFLENKKDNQIGIGYQQVFNNDNYFKVNFLKKISFRKN